jgi:ISXO2-like transposase domain
VWRATGACDERSRVEAFGGLGDETDFGSKGPTAGRLAGRRARRRGPLAFGVALDSNPGLPALQWQLDRAQRQRQWAAALQMPDLPTNIQRAEHHTAGQAAHEGQVAALVQGLSVNKAAAALDVAATTAFRWRHRFLRLAQAVKATELTGVVEADETFFLRSDKGQRPGRKPRKRGGRASRKERGLDLIPILVARDRSGATADFLIDAVSKACLSQALKPHIQSDAILCTDGSAAMAAAANELGVQHEPLNRSAGERVRGPWHIQNANAYHGRLKGWMARFRGVATDYLESYLGWFRALDRASKNRRKVAPMLALAVGLGGHH